MGNLLTFNYWFNMRPGSLDPTMQTVFLVFVLFSVAATFALWLALKRPGKSLYNRIWKKLYTLNLTNCIIGFILLFFTHELIPLLSARFWFLFWGIGLAVWLFFIGRSVVMIPKLKEEIAKEAMYKKYIP